MKKECWPMILMLLVAFHVVAALPSEMEFHSNVFIREWLICGPFANDPGNQMETDFLSSAGGEKAIHPVAGLRHASSSVAEKTVVWQPATADAAGKLDFATYLSPNQKNIAYAAATIHCDRETPALLKTGSNDRLKLWLNGQEIYYHPNTRASGPDADHLQVLLRKGDNLLLAKVDQVGGGWWLYARFEALYPVDEQLFALDPIVSAVSKKIDEYTVADVFSVQAYNISQRPSGPVTLSVLAGRGRQPAHASVPSIAPGKSAWLVVPSNADLNIAGSQLTARLKLSTANGRRSFEIVKDRNTIHPHAGLQIFVVPHSHADLSWPDTPEVCTNLNCQAISQSIDILAKLPDFKFSEEDVFVLQEFLRRHPERTAEVHDLLHKKILECGGFYFGPSELLLGGEGLIRNIYFGKLWLLEKFNYDTKMAWNVDEPGHTLQMPQILTKSGINQFIIWKTLLRPENNLNVTGYVGPNIFHWQAPDGSKVMVTHCPQGYGIGDILRTNDFLTAAKGLQNFIKHESDHSQRWNLPPVILMADGSDCTIPDANVGENAKLWNQLYGYPQVEIAHISQYTQAVEKSVQQGLGELKIVQGELPAWWDGTQSVENDAFMLSRKAEHLVLAAEKFSTMNDLLDARYDYPSQAIEQVWKGRLWVHEHNWGGTNGIISDAVKLARARECHRLAEDVHDAALTDLASQIAFQKRGIPLVVLNSLAWPRKDVVDYIVSISEVGVKELKLQDTRGQAVPAQFNVLARHDDGSLARVQTVFVAEVPSLGYSTFYLSAGKNNPPNTLQVAPDQLENQFFRVTIDSRSGGITSIFDKRNRRELLQTDTYQGNELIAMENLGVDEAEGFTDNWWRMNEQPAAITVTENGPVRTTLRITGKILNSTRIQTISLYADLPRMDLETTLDWNGQKAIQVNATFPFHLEQPRLTYEVPFGDVEYGKENPSAIACHPTVRATNNWIDLSNKEMGITLATEVTPFDVKDRRDERFRDARIIRGIMPPDSFTMFWGGEYKPFTRIALTDPLLLKTDFVVQPILLRSVFSCGDANLYFTQEGEHVYRFAINTHTGGLVRHEAVRFGLEHNTPLTVLRGRATTGGLPDSGSFLSVSQPNVIVSVMKKAEDGQGVVMRCYETDGVETPVSFYFSQPIQSAQHTNLIEQEAKPIDIVAGKLEVRIGKHAIETFKLYFAALAKK